MRVKVSSVVSPPQLTLTLLKLLSLCMSGVTLSNVLPTAGIVRPPTLVVAGRAMHSRPIFRVLVPVNGDPFVDPLTPGIISPCLSTPFPRLIYSHPPGSPVVSSPDQPQYRTWPRIPVSLVQPSSPSTTQVSKHKRRKRKKNSPQPPPSPPP